MNRFDCNDDIKKGEVLMSRRSDISVSVSDRNTKSIDRSSKASGRFWYSKFSIEISFLFDRLLILLLYQNSNDFIKKLK